MAIGPMFGSSQPCRVGTIDGLTRANGFNQLILGQEIKQVSHHKLSYLEQSPGFDADSCIFYQYNEDDVQQISKDAKIKFIAVRAYKYNIVNIYVIFNKSDGFEVLNDFLARYGQFTSRPDAYADVFEWDSSSVHLSLKYQLDIDFGIAVYTCKALDEQIKARMKQRLLQQKTLAEGN